MLAEAHVLMGNYARAESAAERALGLSTSYNIVVPAAAVYLETGREARALARARELSESLPSEPIAPTPRYAR